MSEERSDRLGIATREVLVELRLRSVRILTPAFEANGLRGLMECVVGMPEAANGNINTTLSH